MLTPFPQNNKPTAPEQTPVFESEKSKTLRLTLKVVKFTTFFTGGLSIAFLFRLVAYPGLWFLYWVSILITIVGIGLFQIQKAENPVNRQLIALGLGLSIPLAFWDGAWLTLIKPIFAGGDLIPFWQAAIGLTLFLLVVGLILLVIIATTLNRINQTLKQGLRGNFYDPR